MKITVEKLKELGACDSGIEYFKSKHTKAVELTDLIREDIATNDWRILGYADWLMVHCMIDKQCVDYVLYASELALPEYEREYPGDSRIHNCIQVIKDFRDGGITRKQLLDAADAAHAATHAATDAAHAATAAVHAATHAATDAADAADAAYAAADAAHAAYAAADAAHAAAHAAYATAHAAHAAYYAADAAYDSAHAATDAAYAAAHAAYAAADKKATMIKILEYGVTLLEGKK